MVFTPRFIKCIWNNLHWQYVFHQNPDSPTQEAFLAHYAASNADPGFSWSDRANGLTYLYDISINQAQVTPAIEPHAWRIKQANVNLWKLLPPRILEGPVDWTKLWFETAKLGDVQTLTFILEQGFDVNTQVQPADWTKMWFEAAKCANAEMMKFILGHGFDVNTLDQYGRSALNDAVAPFGGSYPAVELLVEAGIKLENVEELIEMGSKSVCSAGEASEQTKIANYLRRKAAEKTDAFTNKLQQS
jgi:hypothetical protein